MVANVILGVVVGKNLLFVLFFAGLPVIFSGCSATQVVELAASGSGTAEVTIQLHPAFGDYLEDLTATLGTAPDPSGEGAKIFDLSAINAGFAAEPGIALLSASTPNRETLQLHVRFAPLPAIISQRESIFADILDFVSPAHGKGRVVVRLDSMAAGKLLRFVGIDPFVTDSLLPPSGDMTAAEYLEYLVWALEEYHSPEELRRVIPDSTVNTRLQTPGPIQTLRGGLNSRELDRGVATFTTPLLTILTTAQPVEYVIEFSPRR